MSIENNIMEKIVSLAKRRGFIFPTAEKYGGLQGFWDWGPLGVELKNNIKKAWWKKFVQERKDMVGLDSAIITNPKIWEKSGHLKGFHDLFVDCKKCKERFRADEYIEHKTNKKIFNLYKDYLTWWQHDLDKRSREQIIQDKISITEVEAENAKLKIKLLKLGIDPDKQPKTKTLYVPNKNVMHLRHRSLLNEWEDLNLMSSDINIFIDFYLNNILNAKCPSCGVARQFTPSRNFNLMFKTHVGPVEDSASTAYLRPETAQNIFVNFENVLNSSRMKIPFGIAQVGKAFRNEITPVNFIFRLREFEQMEIEYFINPKEDKKWFDYWVKESKQWFLDLGIKKENIKEKKQDKDELAHYSKATTDLEYNWPFMEGFGELIGIANRTDYDLKAHGFEYKDENEKFVPYVIEPSFGVERPALAFLLDAYEEIKGGRTTTTESNKEEEVVLRLHKDLAPIKAAILPLSKKEPVAKLASKVFDDLKSYFMCAYDEVASIGRRYRRQDEIGTPFCVTIDFDSLEDKKVTVRDRDTMKQERVAIEELKSYLEEKLK